MARVGFFVAFGFLACLRLGFGCSASDAGALLLSFVSLLLLRDRAAVVTFIARLRRNSKANLLRLCLRRGMVLGKEALIAPVKT